ncbi:hypothetical protein IMSAGC013_04493 [Lachnospiraceae bacterium]|nr:hypothetical protein IMSAGC013_04493 [Lachnospiraceae bacterium]
MIGEIAKAAEVAGEAAKGISEETKKMVKELDKPLNASDVKEAGDMKENDFKDLLKELDRPLNAEPEREAEPQAERKPDLPKDENVPENDCLQNGSDVNQELERQEVSDSEIGDRQGGRFGDIFRDGEGDKIEVHHMPADSVTELPRNDGPAIRMDKSDHRETASCGNSREAREYRERQKELIDEGKFDEAVQMDIDDIREKFGDKYDDAINEMLAYIDELKEAGKI